MDIRCIIPERCDISVICIEKSIFRLSKFHETYPCSKNLVKNLNILNTFTHFISTGETFSTYANTAKFIGNILLQFHGDFLALSSIYYRKQGQI